MDLKALLEEWHKTKNLSLAYDICQKLYDEMKDFEDEPKLD
jgi:hypothetical protein